MFKIFKKHIDLDELNKDSYIKVKNKEPETLIEYEDIELIDEITIKKENTIEVLKEQSKDVISDIASEKVILNPTFNKDLIDKIYAFEEKFIKTKMPGSPSYIIKNDKGQAEVSLALLLDINELLDNEKMINEYTLYKEVNGNTLYDTFQLGRGYSVNSYGYIYLNNDLVFNPDDLSSIPVYKINFNNNTMLLGFNNKKNNNNNFIAGGTKDIGLSVKLDVLGFNINELKNDLLDNNEYIDNNNTNILGLNNVTLNDLYNAYLNNGTISKDEIKNILISETTNSNYFNIEIDTEEDDPKRKNYMMLYFLLLLGGGQVGVTPLPNSSDPCDVYKKPQRTGIGFGSEQPGGGCKAKNYYTGHHKVFDGSNPNGITTSLIQLLYRFLMPFYNINLKGYTFKLSLLGKTAKIKIIPSLSIGGELEAGICKLQESISKLIRKFFSVKKYIKLPYLTDEGTGYNFKGYDTFNMSDYENIQVEMYFRLNFARIYNYVETDILYDTYDDDDKTLDSKLLSVVNIYSDTDKYKLSKMNSYKKIDLTIAKEMHDKGFHILYNDNNINDEYYLSMTDDKKNEYLNVSPNTIWTVLKNSMADIDSCKAFELKLELFNANDFSYNAYEYTY